KRTARLDWLMCLTWFGLGVALSQPRIGDILNVFYNAGGPLIPAPAVRTAQTLWSGFTIVVTALFAMNFLRQPAQIRRASRIKLAIMMTSFVFWWYTQVYIGNILLGLAMFEVFHDVQYLGIVWIFNQKRVANDPQVGRFTSLLFRPNRRMVGFYVGLCLAYA